MKACSMCGRPARLDQHHLTGTDFGGDHLDPDFTTPLCHDHHELFGDDWHTLDIFDLRAELSLIDAVELRLLRLAAGLARIDLGRGGGTLLGQLAEVLGRWAVELRRFKAALDALHPEWRRYRAFYPERSE